MAEGTMYVNSTFKLRTEITREMAESLFGKQIDDDELFDFLLMEDKPYALPYGSNHSLKISTLGNSIDHPSISIYGELDDYYNDAELEEWFKRSCMTMANLVESAVMEYRLSGRGSVICTCNNIDWILFEKFYMYNF